MQTTDLLSSPSIAPQAGAVAEPLARPLHVLASGAAFALGGGAAYLAMDSAGYIGRVFANSGVIGILTTAFFAAGLANVVYLIIQLVGASSPANSTVWIEAVRGVATAPRRQAQEILVSALARTANDPLDRRVFALLVNWLQHRDDDRAGSIATADADLARSELDSAISLTQFAQWAMPTLGFIGTVYGIALAVTKFTGFLSELQDVTKIQQGISLVAGGLGTAFDTTLLALVLVLPLSALATYGRNLGEKIVAREEHWIAHQIVARLPSGQAVSYVQLTPDSLQKLEAIVEATGRQVRAAEPTPDGNLDRVADALEQVVRSAEAVENVERIEALAAEIAALKAEIRNVQDPLRRLAAPRRIILTEDVAENA